jgi:hypothetical protein
MTRTTKNTENPEGTQRILCFLVVVFVSFVANRVVPRVPGLSVSGLWALQTPKHCYNSTRCELDGG